MSLSGADDRNASGSRARVHRGQVATHGKADRKGRGEESNNILCAASSQFKACSRLKIVVFYASCPRENYALKADWAYLRSGGLSSVFSLDTPANKPQPALAGSWASSLN